MYLHYIYLPLVSVTSVTFQTRHTKFSGKRCHVPSYRSDMSLRFLLSCNKLREKMVAGVGGACTFSEII